jgi:hypothetical protein
MVAILEASFQDETDRLVENAKITQNKRRILKADQRPGLRFLSLIIDFLLERQETVWKMKHSIVCHPT